jgi:hypothetical protein
VSNASTTSLPRFSQRSSSGIFSLAAAALDRTQSAFYNISDPVIRPRQSNPGLARLSFAAGSPTSAEPASPIKKQLFRTPSAQSLASNPSAADGKLTSVALPAKAPLSSPYSETDPTLPPPIKFAGRDNKMHQTSSRLLRMTDDERPFTKVRKVNSTLLHDFIYFFFLFLFGVLVVAAAEAEWHGAGHLVLVLGGGGGGGGAVSDICHAACSLHHNHMAVPPPTAPPQISPLATAVKKFQGLCR